MHVNQAVILVGGFGTRLGELTKHTPKPLLPILGKPFLEYLMTYVAKFSVTEIILLAGYLGDQVKVLYDQKNIGGAQIKVIVEPEPLGTAGALKFAAPHLDDEFFLLNGDTFFNIDLGDLSQDLDHKNWQGVLALYTAEDTQRYGTVEIDGECCIQAFVEKSAHKNSPNGYINGGVYLLKKDILSLIKHTPSSLEKDVFPILVQQKQLFGKPYDKYFIDIGLPSTLKQAQEELLENIYKVVEL